MSTALPSYSFDTIGPSFTPVGSSASEAAADSGRYIQDDLPMTTVLLPDGTSLPISSFAANSSMFASPGMVDGAASTGLSGSHSQGWAYAATVLDSMVSGSDSLNAGGIVGESMTSEELNQYLQNGPVLTEMPSGEFFRQFDAVPFQQTNDSATGLPQ